MIDNNELKSVISMQMFQICLLIEKGRLSMNISWPSVL